jgi:hypothetical protein
VPTVERIASRCQAGAVAEGLLDARAPVIENWGSQRPRFRPPIVATGDVIGRSVVNEIVVGFSRRGARPGLTDREVVPAMRHRVLLGMRLG